METRKDIYNLWIQYTTKVNEIEKKNSIFRGWQKSAAYHIEWNLYIVFVCNQNKFVLFSNDFKIEMVCVKRGRATGMWNGCTISQNIDKSVAKQLCCKTKISELCIKMQMIT